MTADAEPHQHGRVCSTCARKVAERLITLARFSTDLTNGASSDEQLLQVFLAGAALLAAKMPGAEGDRGTLLFREMARAMLELTPEQMGDVS